MVGIFYYCTFKKAFLELWKIKYYRINRFSVEGYIQYLEINWCLMLNIELIHMGGSKPVYEKERNKKFAGRSKYDC